IDDNILTMLMRSGYCCCGKDQGKPVIATFCPKHGATALNSGAGLECALDDNHAKAHTILTGCNCRQMPGDSGTCKVHNSNARHFKTRNGQMAETTGKKQYVLTDGSGDDRIHNTRWMNAAELAEAQERVKGATEGNLWWEEDKPLELP